MGVNSLPKAVTRQRRDCDLNRGPSAPESSMLTTRLPSHPEVMIGWQINRHVQPLCELPCRKVARGVNGVLPPETRMADSGAAVLGEGQLAPSHQQGGLGSAVSFSSRVRGGALAAQRFSYILRSPGSLCCYVLRETAAEVPQSGNKEGCTKTPRGRTLHKQGGYHL